jgi:hypothetical protein
VRRSSLPRLGTTESELEHPLHLRRQIVTLQLPLDCTLVQLLQGAALLLQPMQQPRYLVDTGNGAPSELG